jgi:hypothetical protein
MPPKAEGNESPFPIHALNAGAAYGPTGAQYGLPSLSYATSYPERHVKSSPLAWFDGVILRGDGPVDASEHAAIASAALTTSSSFFTATSPPNCSSNKARSVLVRCDEHRRKPGLART